MQSIVYHGSSKRGMKEIKPQDGSHGKKWVYGTKDLVVSACFITGFGGGDFAYYKGRDVQTGKFCICERFQGAFEKLFQGVKGSIYELASETFKENMTQWQEEVVSEQAVTPLREIKIENNFDFLSEFEKNGELIIKRFPEKTKEIPDDDEDLVFRAIIWSKQFDRNVIEKFIKMHSVLYQALVAGSKSVEKSGFLVPYPITIQIFF
jgi:hypothetical protein